MSGPDRLPGEGRRWLTAILGRHRFAGCEDTPATAALPRFQRDAALRLIERLERFGGALLADDVGLGKTHVSLAVLRSRPSWRPCLIVAPAAVLPRWEQLLEREKGIDSASFARLSRGLVAPPEGGYRLAVVDEAHRLRNPNTKRYRALVALLETARVLLVTASPIHNRARDLGALLHLFWPSAVAADRDPERLRAVLSEVLVRRTRWTVERAYLPEHRRIAGLTAAPSRHRRVVDVVPGLELERLLDDIPAVARAAAPELAAGEASSLLSQLLVRRLESSTAAFCTTLRRCRNYLSRAAEAARRGERLSRGRFRRLFGDGVEQQVAQMLLPFFFTGDSPPAVDWLAGLPLIEKTLERWERASSGDDPKLVALEALRRAAPGLMVIMSCFEDTARWIYRSLDGERWLVTGRGALSSRFGRVTRSLALSAFGPRPRLRPEPGACLIATDVISEGVDLQGAVQLVHYDRPWNPMAVEQRIGRLDRIGASSERVDEVVLRMSGEFARRLEIEAVLERKLDVARTVLGGSVDGAGDDVGLDREGLLIACWARLQGSSSKRTTDPPPASSASREHGTSELDAQWLVSELDAQWLVAVQAGGWLDVYAVGGGKVDLASPSLLVALARDELDTTRAAAPRWLTTAAVERARSDRARHQLLLREPGAPSSAGGYVLELATDLGRQAREAYHRGDARCLENVEYELRRATTLGVAVVSRSSARSLETCGPAESPAIAAAPAELRVVGALCLTEATGAPVGHTVAADGCRTM